jgi:hypothetical protein
VYTINVFLPRANIFLLLAKIIVDNSHSGTIMGARERNALMSPEAYENALDRQYDDHVAEMEEMGFDKEAAEWYAYEDFNDTRIDNLQDYFFNEDVFQKSEALRLRDGIGQHSWAALDSVLTHGTDKEIADYMRSIRDVVTKKADLIKSRRIWRALNAPLPWEVRP